MHLASLTTFPKENVSNSDELNVSVIKTQSGWIQKTTIIIKPSKGMLNQL